MFRGEIFCFCHSGYNLFPAFPVDHYLPLLTGREILRGEREHVGFLFAHLFCEKRRYLAS